MTKYEQYAQEHNCTVWQAKYILEPGRRSKEYKPRPRQTYTKQYFDDLGVTIKVDETSESGYAVYQKGLRRVISPLKSAQYKNGNCKYHLYTFLKDNGKQKNVSLAILIWILIMNNNEVPSGYVVDHIDNDSFNNNPDNLQLLTIRENIEKNPSKKQKLKNLK